MCYMSLTLLDSSASATHTEACACVVVPSSVSSYSLSSMGGRFGLPLVFLQAPAEL